MRSITGSDLLPEAFEAISKNVALVWPVVCHVIHYLPADAAKPARCSTLSCSHPSDDLLSLLRILGRNLKPNAALCQKLIRRNCRRNLVGNKRTNPHGFQSRLQTLRLI